ncbi:MAG: four helix bundle protein [Thermomicrobiales bacterium]
MKVADFRGLRVYQNAADAAAEIFELSRRFPVEERYSLTDQVRRSSRSVCANIAEAWRKRRYPAAFVSKLSDADAEAAETQAWVDIARRCGYIDSEVEQRLLNRYHYICAQLVTMMSSPEQWSLTAQPRSKDH